jgi:endonuclease-3
MARFYRSGKGGGTNAGRRPAGRRSATTGRGGPGDPTSGAAGPPVGDRTTAKEAFDIDEVFRRLRLATAALPKAAMFDLRDRGYASPFEQLVGSLISARTRDETTVKVCLRLFEVARTPSLMLELDEAELTRRLAGASFADVKARDLREIARRILEEWGGEVPDDLHALTSLRGVGPKIAALTLAVGFGRPAIAVDIHVHRIVNRWGYVAATTPEKTMLALAEVLPERYWIEINERLVPFGKFVCTGTRPKCPRCPLLSMCRQVGVGDVG